MDGLVKHHHHREWVSEFEPCPPTINTQVLGDTPILPLHAPFITFSLMPLLCVVIAAVSQYGLHTSEDFAATCVSLVAAWVYLRWLHTYAPGAVGDTRDEFEFLSMIPNPIR